MKTDMRESAQSNADEIDLRELMGVLLDHKWWIASITGAFVLVAGIYALLAAPVYRADAVVQVESRTPAVLGVTDVAQSLGLGRGAADANTEMALISSRSVIGSAVRTLGLDIEVSSSRFPVFGGLLARRAEASHSQALSDVRFGLNQFGWGGERLRIHQMDVPSDLLGEKLHLVAGVDGDYVLFDRKGEQLLAGKVGTLATGAGMTMQVSEMRAHPGMRFQVTRLEERSVVNRLQKAVVVTEAGKNSGILRLAYEGVEPELVRTVLQQVASAYVSQNVERGSAEASAQLKFVREQLPVVRVQVETAQAALSDYQTRANSVDLALQTKGLLDQEVAIEAALQQLQLQRAEMEGKFTRDHPAYRTLLRQVGDLEERRRGFAGQVRRLPEAQQELLRLTRDLKVANEMYTAMLNQVQQLDVARAGSVGNVRIVDAAEVDKSTPVAPRRLLIVAIGMMTGLFLSIGLVLLRKLMSRGIEDPAQIEALGMSVYAAIPLSVQQQSELSIQPSGVVEAKLLALINPADLAVEAIRSLRTSLHFARLESKNNVVVISGATPGAGKTFVSSNLAGVVAQAGQRVLIIDADMRKGVLHKIFGTKQGPGLSELLAGSAVLERVVHTVPGLETLSFISRGAIPPNPSELLMHRNFTDLLTEVGERFDLIIIDTPPILAVTDAAIVGSHAGICLLVARCGLNQRRELESARNRFEQNKVQLKGVVFNAVKRKATDSYGYGYYEYSSTAS